MSDAEIDRLPEPELFRDAMTLYQHGTFSPADLDAVDALLLGLLRLLWNAKRG